LRDLVNDRPALEAFCTGKSTTTTTTTNKKTSGKTTTTTTTTNASGGKKTRTRTNGRARATDDDGRERARDRTRPSKTRANDEENDEDNEEMYDDDAFDAVAYARAVFSRSRADDASSTSTLDDVATLAEGARLMEQMIREEVVTKREALERAAKGAREATEALDVIRRGAADVREAFARVEAELGDPHREIELATITMNNAANAAETLRSVARVVKLCGKLREAYEGREKRSRDVGELAKLAKLLGEIKIALANGDFNGIDVVDENMAFIRECSSAVAREAAEALSKGVENASQADVGAALQVHYNLNDLNKVVDGRVAAHASAAVEAFKDAVDAESIGRTASGAASGAAPRLTHRASAPPSGSERAWIDALWSRVDVAMERAHENAMAVWHLQRVLAKKRDPLTQALFLDEVVGKSASAQALCDRFWALFAKGVSEHLSRTHAAAGFVSGALLKGFPRLVGALERAVEACARDADAAKGAPGCTRKDGSTRAQVARAAEPIAAAYLQRSLTRLTEAANNCFASGRVVDEVAANKFLSRVRTEIDAVAEYDNLLNSACGNAATALKALADRAKRAVIRSSDAGNLTEDATPSQRTNAQIAEQLSRVHALLSRVLPSFAPTPRRAMEGGLEHVALAVKEAMSPLFEAVGDWCDARFAQMHGADYATPSDAQSAHIAAVTSTLAHIAEAQKAGLMTLNAVRGPLFSVRLKLGERILTSFVDHASLVREFAQGGKMRLVRECNDVESAVTTHLRLAGAETDSPAFKSVRAFKSLVLLPIESISGSPLLRDLPRRALLHHLYSRAPKDLHTPAKRASLSATQYATWLTKKAPTDAEIWRGVKGTIDVYEETHAADARSNAAVALMRAVGSRDY